MAEFQHMELNTTDPKAAKKFYGSVFGWKFDDMKMSDGSVYSMIRDGKKGIGGIQKKPMPDAPTMWLGYVTVASVKQTTAKAAKLGGTVIVPSMDIPNMGSFGIFTDPQGAPIAVWQAAMPAAKRPAAKKTAKKSPAKKAAKKPAPKKKKAAKKR